MAITNSERAKDFAFFALAVIHHIDDYTVPQYGDKGKDQVTNWSPEFIQEQLRKYMNRMGKNQRGQQDQLKDLLKIAHYSQLLYDKLQTKDSSPPNSDGSITGQLP